MKQTDAPTLQLAARDYERFNRLLMERCGMHFSEARQIELALGVQQAFAASTCTNLDAYYRLLKNAKADASEMDRLINAVTVGETYFFRNQPQFDALYHHVLPEIIQRRRNARALRIWSAGCASGEEPYSVAMLLRQLLPDVDNWDITILGTDINHEALARARRAVYGEWAFRESRARLWRGRYFEPEGKRYHLQPEIWQMVKFARLNLVEDVYPSEKTHTTDLDLILCRNVTIYFSEMITRAVVERFYEALNEGGWLVVGHAEPSLSVYQKYATYNYPGTILYRREDTVVSSPNPMPTWEAPVEGAPVSRASATASPAPAMEQSAVDTLDYVRQCLETGHIEQARESLLNVIQVQPDNAAACALMGQAYANLGDWAEAEHWCRRAVHLDRLASPAYYTLALVLQHQARLDEAIDTMKKVVYLDRNNILGHFGLANLYRDKAQWTQAHKSLDNAQRLLQMHADGELVPGSGGVTVGSLRQTIVRQRRRWPSH